MTGVNENYYNATTKAGNPYHKTNANKKVCVGANVLGVAAGTAFSANLLKDVYNATIPAGAEKLTFLKSLGDFVKLHKLGLAGALGGAVLGGLITGAIIDGIVNKVRAKRADKLMQTPLLDKQV